MDDSGKDAGPARKASLLPGDGREGSQPSSRSGSRRPSVIVDSAPDDGKLKAANKKLSMVSFRYKYLAFKLTGCIH